MLTAGSAHRMRLRSNWHCCQSPSPFFFSLLFTCFYLLCTGPFQQSHTHLIMLDKVFALASKAAHAGTLLASSFFLPSAYMYTPFPPPAKWVDRFARAHTLVAERAACLWPCVYMHACTRLAICWVFFSRQRSKRSPLCSQIAPEHNRLCPSIPTAPHVNVRPLDRKSVV